MNCDNKYVPTHAEDLSLPWYERDGLMSYIDSLKCYEFKTNSEEHFNKTKTVNFAMIHAQAISDKLDQELLMIQGVYSRIILTVTSQRRKLLLQQQNAEGKICMSIRSMLRNILRNRYNFCF